MQLRIVVVLVLTAVFLVAALWGIDLNMALAALRDVRWVDLLLVEAIYVFTHAMRVLRMQALIDRPVAFKRVLSILTIGYLAIHVVPFRMGEFVRPYLLAEREQVPFTNGLAIILVERLLDMIMLLGMLFGVAWVVQLPPGAIMVEGVDVLAAGQKIVGLMVVGGFGVIAAVGILGESLLKRTDRLPGGGLLRGFYDGIRAVPRDPLRVVYLVGLSAAIWGLTIVAVKVLLGAFPGMPSSFAEAYTIWTITLAGMTAVPTPGFFGPFEAACTAAISLFGGDRNVAGTFAIVLHLSQFLFTVVGGVLFLLNEGLSLRDVVGKSRDVAGAKS